MALSIPPFRRLGRLVEWGGPAGPVELEVVECGQCAALVSEVSLAAHGRWHLTGTATDEAAEAATE